MKSPRHCMSSPGRSGSDLGYGSAPSGRGRTVRCDIPSYPSEPRGSLAARAGEALFNSEGKPTRLLGVTTDVTALKVAQERVREAENRFRALVEQIAAVTYIAQVLDAPEGPLKKIYVSPQIKLLLATHLTSGWRLGLWIQSVHPDDRSRVEDAVVNAEDKPVHFAAWRGSARATGGKSGSGMNRLVSTTHRGNPDLPGRNVRHHRGETRGGHRTIPSGIAGSGARGGGRHGH